MKINLRTICVELRLKLMLVYEISEQALLGRKMDWKNDNKECAY